MADIDKDFNMMFIMQGVWPANVNKKCKYLIFPFFDSVEKCTKQKVY